MYPKFGKSLFVIMSLLLILLTATANAQEVIHSSAERGAIEVDRQESIDNTLSLTASTADMAETVTLWTREAFMAAEPIALPESPMDEPLLEEAVVETGVPGFIDGGAPALEADLEAQQMFPEEWAMLEESETLDNEALGLEGTSQVFTRYLVNYYSQSHQQFPYRAMGKLYFRDANNNPSYCSASVISPNNIIVTAAHCVYNTSSNRWHSNFVFVPAERNYAQPYRSFPFAQARVLNSWINLTGNYSIDSWAKHDVAVLSLQNNSAGRPVTYYTGWLGRSWNYGYTQHHHFFGYPSNLNLRYTFVCTAESFGRTTDTLGMGCDMQSGSSGGPWMRQFAPYTTFGNYVNSVNSGRFIGINNSYGARFSSSNIVPLCNAQGC